MREERRGGEWAMAQVSFFSFLTLLLLHICRSRVTQGCVDFVIQPVAYQTNYSLTRGDSVAFTCRAKGTASSRDAEAIWVGPDGTEIENTERFQIEINEKLTKMMIISNVREEDAGVYTCKCRHHHNPGSSFRLQVRASITWEFCPDVQYIQLGTRSDVTCKVSHSDKVIWKKGNRILKTGVNLTRLEFRNVSLLDEGTYTCRAVATRTGQTEARDIKVMVSSPVHVRHISVGPQMTTNETAAMTCVATGRPRVSYFWTDTKGENISGVKWDRFLVNHTHGTLTIKNLRLEDNGAYTCIARNTISNDTGTVNLVVMEKPSVVVFEKTIGICNSMLKLICIALGFPVPTITLSTTNGERDFFKTSIEDDARVTEMIITKLTPNSSGTCTCRADNDIGTDSKMTFFTVKYPPTVRVDKEVVFSSPGHTVSLKCIAIAEPVASFTWMFHGKKVTGKESHINQTDVGNTSILKVTPRNESDFGKYWCLAENVVSKNCPNTTSKVQVQLRRAQEAPDPGVTHSGYKASMWLTVTLIIFCISWLAFKFLRQG